MSDRAWADADYSRIYHTVIDDQKFAEVYADDRRWAWYTRLLMLGDSTYPASAPLPRALPDDVLDHLVEADIVVLIGVDHYRIKATMTEREDRATGRTVGGRARATTASRNVAGQFVAGDLLGNAGFAGDLLDPVAGPAPAGPANPAKTRRDETRQERDEGGVGGDPADTYWRVTGHFPSQRLLTWIDRDTERFGKDQMSAAIAQAHINSNDPKDLMARASDIAARTERAAVIKERSDELIRNAEKRTGISILRRAPEEDLSEDEIQRQVDEYNAKHGKAG